MTLSQTATTSVKSSQEFPEQSSMITKLARPFASKQHTQIKHEIELEDPFRCFAPGEAVKGSVHIHAAKPVRATHLVIRLHGFVKVIAHSKLPGEPIPYDEQLLNSAKGRRGGEYFGNGFARLFEDEIVLCGDGRLLGQYVFRFELDLPQTGVPSSIDVSASCCQVWNTLTEIKFENGTITYLITSILTRPTAISPTLVREVKLKVKENIDIAPIPIPRPQSVWLEPVMSIKPVVHMKRRLSAQQPEKMTAKTSQDGSKDGSGSSPASTIDVPCSPVPSEISSTSITSSSMSNTYTAAGGTSATDIKSTNSGSISLATSDKTITAQIEFLQGGCLPGDVVPIRVSVDHTKPIKSMQGVIITLYRSARVDTHPALPLGPSNRQGNAKYEDYYPKSRTGLGGLSLSSAGSSRTFRQDLAQTITPLMVDPQSLTAIIKTSIRVPEHIFPTIRGVPGAMIIFKYFIEVVIDLRGKLGQDRLLPKFSMTDTPQHAYGDPILNMEHGQDGMRFSATPGFNYVITDQLRRQKGVIHTKTEVIIGTQDTARSRVKQREENGGVEGTRQSGYAPLLGADQSRQEILDGYVPDYSRRQQHNDPVQSNALPRDVVPPIPETEEPLDEKARIRRAEQILLPSAPAEDIGISPVAAPTPSAPFAYDEEDFIQRYVAQAPAPAYDGPAMSPSSLTITPNTEAQSLLGPSRNWNEHSVRMHPMIPAQTIDAGDDKQERERQRLQTLASAPNNEDEEGAPVMTTTQQTSNVAPMAPVPSEDDVNNANVEESSSTDESIRMFDANPISSMNVSSASPLPDKQEFERLRLQKLASSSVSPSGDDVETSANLGSRPVRYSVSIIDEHDVQNVPNDDSNGTNNDGLPIYKR